mmetsp:Transcript_24689/g.46124  ORF Transcript_24689/g.46124 Transcript_24689/m.46124 type:complete len:114 (-) Transcript_24689:318-659(-)|eukprot:CAMPEP_0170172774 /NCGR_PEP_ID=MMETSP0040_2-20121228/6044_1 /TAXON_ID=641309 /ORGANISM="Lotharella oceanica, Strain CCMP622" /LENGTH=113 /DNA_ID=CAMNT_0010413607 /DNA_START=38 /DNA_END=379 /DNA_ORIENTATION=-
MGASGSTSADGFVRQTIKSNPCVVFSATYCPYCTKAKAVLKDVGANMKVVEVDVVENGRKYKSQLSKISGRTSVPQVFVGGKFIGGCNDGPGVVPLQAQGKLVPMLKEAGALA